MCAGPNVHLKTRQKSRGCIPDSPWSQASSRGEAKDSALLSSRTLLSRSGGLLLEKLTHSLQIEASKNRPGGCLFLPEGGLLFLPPMIPGFQHGGKADLGDLCSGVVSTELGLCPETHTYRGRQNHMNKSLLSKRALVNLSL